MNLIYIRKAAYGIRQLQQAGEKPAASNVREALKQLDNNTLMRLHQTLQRMLNET